MITLYVYFHFSIVVTRSYPVYFTRRGQVLVEDSQKSDWIYIVKSVSQTDYIVNPYLEFPTERHFFSRNISICR